MNAEINFQLPPPPINRPTQSQAILMLYGNLRVDSHPNCAVRDDLYQELQHSKMQLYQSTSCLTNGMLQMYC